MQPDAGTIPAHFASRCMPFLTAVSQRIWIVTVFFFGSAVGTGVGAGVALGSGAFVPFAPGFCVSIGGTNGVASVLDASVGLAFFSGRSVGASPCSYSSLTLSGVDVG